MITSQIPEHEMTSTVVGNTLVGNDLLDERRLENLTRFACLLGFYDSSSPENSPSSSLVAETSSCNGTTNASQSAQFLISQRKTGKADRTKTVPVTHQELALELQKCLHRDDKDAVGGSIIKIPSMELESTDNESIGANDLLPKLGQSHFNQPGKSQGGVDGTGAETASPTITDIEPKPQMAASVLHMMTDADKIKLRSPSPPELSNSSPVSSPRPSLLPDSASTDNDKNITDNSMESTSSSAATKLEIRAGSNMSRPLSFTRSSAHHGPSSLIRSLFTSFSALVTSRVRTWTLLLLKHSLSSGDKESRNRLMSLLAAENALKKVALCTAFEVQSVSPEAKKGLFAEGRLARQMREIALSDGKNIQNLSYCDLVLPMQFKASIDLCIQNNPVTVHLSAPGSVGAIFHDNESTITFAESTIDTNTLISSMVQQARLVVFQAVARSTSSSSQIMKKIQPAEHASHSSKQPSPHLQTARSSLGLSSRQFKDNASFNVSTRARITPDQSASLLRQQGSFAQSRNRARSIQWDESVKKSSYEKKAEASRKRGRKSTLSGPSLKRSTKSFGKPGSNVFECSRNATFAEFGNVGNSPHLSCRSESRQEAGSSAYHVSTHMLRRNRFCAIPENSSNKQFELRKPSSSGGSGHTLERQFSSFGHTLERRKPSFQELSRSAVSSVPPPSTIGSVSRLQDLADGSMKRTLTQLEAMLLNFQVRNVNPDSGTVENHSDKNATFH